MDNINDEYEKHNNLLKILYFIKQNCWYKDQSW